MKNKKNIMLFALLGIMVIVALIVFLRPKRRRGCSVQTPATTVEPAVIFAADAALPAHQEIKALSDWFVQNDTAKLVATCPTHGVFGLDGALHQTRSAGRGTTPFPGPPARGPLAALAGLIAGPPRSGSLHAEAPPPAVPMVIEQVELQSLPDLSAETTSSGAPMQLSGVICMGGARVALFGAESYSAGDTIPNTPYRIVAIDADAVTLRSAEGQKLRLNLLN